MVEEETLEFTSPLFSPETLQFMLNEITSSLSCTSEPNIENFPAAGEIQTGNNSAEIMKILSSESASHVPCTSIVNVPQMPSSSLPAIQTWPGEYGFTVSFDFQEKNTKNISWTYSSVRDKLYVKKDVACPINFSANTILPSDVCIRVMALYTIPEQVSEAVRRCINHSMEEIRNGIPEAEHLVRCESSMAVYHVDLPTGRHSVIVPFENPSVGQEYSTYIFKFVCFGSCAGGPNRRPLMLIFTLERGNQVIGRRKLDVKICACPGRDKKTEEEQTKLTSGHISNKRKEPHEYVNLSNTQHTSRSSISPSKKTKASSSQDGGYTLRIADEKGYEFLLQMKSLYETYQKLENIPRNLITALLHSKSKTGEKNE